VSTGISLSPANRTSVSHFVLLLLMVVPLVDQSLLALQGARLSLIVNINGFCRYIKRRHIKRSGMLARWLDYIPIYHTEKILSRNDR